MEIENKSRIHRISLPFQLLKTFTEKELDNFTKLLESGYLSTNESLSTLLKILKKQALHYTSYTALLQYEVYTLLYQKEKTGDVLNELQRKKLNRLMNDLLNAAEKFLMFESIKYTREHDTILLFPHLASRKQMLLYSKHIKATEKKFKNEQKRGVDYHNQYFNIQSERANLLYMNNSLSKEDNFDELQYHLDAKYILQKLQYHLAKITLQQRYAHKTFDFQPYEALQTLLNVPNYKTNALIRLYVLNIQLVETKEKASFLALSKLLKEKQEDIPTEYLGTFYTNLANYCTYEITKGDLNFFNHLFEIYNDMHEADLFVLNNAVDAGHLKNIITTACRVKAFDWAIGKLNYYISFVPTTIRNTVFEYNCGIIAFNQQEYETALMHLNKVRKVDDTHELTLRITQLQCFYEIDVTHENSTQQLLETLRTYIQQNKKLTKRQKRGYFNFIRVFNKLYKLKNIVDKNRQKNAIEKQVPKLKALLLQFNSLMAKQWLLNKIKLMECDTIHY